MSHNNIRVVIPESPIEGTSDASTAKRPSQAWESASYEGKAQLLQLCKFGEYLLIGLSYKAQKGDSKYKCSPLPRLTHQVSKLLITLEGALTTRGFII